jgi:lipoprotein-anchoring transpeptidase ErfK/SrfK
LPQGSARAAENGPPLTHQFALGSRRSYYLTMRPAISIVLLAVLLAGCGGGANEAEPPVERTSGVGAAAVALGPGSSTRRPIPPDLGVSEVTSGRPQSKAFLAGPATCKAGTERKLRSRSLAFAGVATRRVTAYRKPGRQALRTFRRMNVNDFPTVFGVLAAVQDRACRPTWYRVQLPIRPNGSVGYVRAGTIELVAVRSRIVVDLSERRLSYYSGGKLVHRLTTAVGSKSTPTPTGRYYVNQRLIPTDPTGPYGPAAIGISAFSPVLIYWPQGGPIAIHGTNNPSSIGKPTSNGCLRLANDDLMLIWNKTPAGTPVVIRA